MKKLLLAFTLFSGHFCSAQQSFGNYVLKVQTAQPYTPLTTGTNISSSIVWDDENFKFPLGFTLNIDGKTTTDFSFSAGEGFGPGSDTMGVVNTFSNFGASDLIDRGTLSATPKSPLRYLTTGTSPNRIFKFEAYNAGFFDEADLYGTVDDSVNFQIWVYETSNIIEFRYGSSKISNPADYFYLGGSPLIGLAIDFDLDATTFTKAYTLVGSPSAPTVDSFVDFSALPPVMSSYPANGTVYRFIPKAVAASIGESSIAQQFNVYPTVTRETLTVDYNLNTKTRVDIYSATGQIVQSTFIQQGSNVLDVSALAGGTYLLQLSNNDGKAGFKFMKQ